MTPKAKSDTKPQPQPATPAPAPAAPAPQAAVAAAPKPSTASKQEATTSALIEGWKAKGLDPNQITVKQDGKYLVAVVGDGWPEVHVGPTGGVSLPAIRSYAKPFDAAMDGKALLEKQTARDQKKQTASAPATPKPQTGKPEPAKAVTPEAPKETPAAKKTKAHSQIEERLQAQA